MATSSNQRGGPKEKLENTSVLPEGASDDSSAGAYKDEFDCDGDEVDDDDWDDPIQRDDRSAVTRDTNESIQSRQCDRNGDETNDMQQAAGRSEPKSDPPLDDSARLKDGRETGLDLPELDLDKPDRDDDAETAAQPKKPKKGVRSGRHKNAIKHGAYAQDCFLPGESGTSFDRLHQSLVDEWTPTGETENQLILTMARGHWNLRRAEEWGRDELLLVQELPRQRELELIKNVASRLAAGVKDATVVKCDIGLLRDQYRRYIDSEFPRSNYKDPLAWIDALRSSAMPFILEIQEHCVLLERHNLSWQTQQAERRRTVHEAILARQARIQANLEKTIKTLVQVKLWKSTVPQIKRIENRNTSDSP